MARTHPLDTARIVQTAIGIADAEGLEGVSMRKLGQKLGVEAMSLYHYVPNKAHLIALMIDAVVQEMALPAAGTPWKPAMRAMCISAHDRIGAHPWVVTQLMSVQTGFPLSRFRWMDALMGCLRSNGFSVRLTHHTYHVLDGHILGFSYWAATVKVAPEDSASLLDEVMSLAASANLHWFLEHIEYHLVTDGTEEDTSEFAFALDLILDGIERLAIAELA